MQFEVSPIRGVRYPDYEALKEAVKDWQAEAGGTDRRFLF